MLHMHYERVYDFNFVDDKLTGKYLKFTSLENFHAFSIWSTYDALAKSIYQPTGMNTGLA